MVFTYLISILLVVWFVCLFHVPKYTHRFLPRSYKISYKLCNNLSLTIITKIQIEMLTVYLGGILPYANLMDCCSHRRFANRTGFFIPLTAPTAPNCKLLPSITLASHSTVPSQVRFDPNPAFVIGESSRTITVSTTASNTLLPDLKLSAPYYVENMRKVNIQDPYVTKN